VHDVKVIPIHLHVSSQKLLDGFHLSLVFGAYTVSYKNFIFVHVSPVLHAQVKTISFLKNSSLYEILVHEVAYISLKIASFIWNSL